MLPAPFTPATSAPITVGRFLLDRGLDIYQHYDMNDAFAFANRLQQFRSCKAFEVTYLRVDPS